MRAAMSAHRKRSLTPTGGPEAAPAVDIPVLPPRRERLPMNPHRLLALP
jgi:hypothetical protein